MTTFAKHIQLDTNAFSDQITTVVLTGGPCAGKTTLMEKFRNEVNNIPNVKVFFAKEAATFLKQSGINFVDAGADSTFQRLIIEQQLVAEYNARVTAEKFAENHPNHKIIIVCDRGIMDGEAYFENKHEFAELLADFELTKKTVYKRYDKVVFLRSAAVGAPEFYTTMDGTPRDETPEKAITLDSGVYDAWSKHPNFCAIENSFKFYEKLDIAVGYILEAAGIQIPRKVFKRYLIKAPNLIELLGENNTVTVNEQIFFLNSPDSSIVYYTKVQRKGNEVRYSKREVRLGLANNNGKPEYTRIFEQDNTLTEDEFLKELAQLNPVIMPLQRTLFTFTTSFSVRCELEIYPLIHDNMILKVYSDSENDYKHLASRYQILEDVTHNVKYSTLEIAKSSCKVLAD